MDRYNISRSLVGAGLVDDTANALALRSDIHLSFDVGTFVFTRKLDQWVSHFLTPTSDLGPEYHNTTVKIPYSVHPAFLLARLAWTIFPSIRNFLIRGEKRLVIEVGTLDTVPVATKAAASVAIADGLGDAGDRRDREKGSDVRSKVGIEVPSWRRAVVREGPVLEGWDNRVFVRSLRAFLLRGIRRPGHMEEVVSSSQHSLFVQFHFISTPPFCEPSIPNIASNDSANQKRRSIMNAAVGSVKCGELDQARGIVRWMVKADTVED